MSGADPEGLLLVDKPAGWTSHDVVARVRRLLGTRRVGHAGTLDPMATGVLVVGVGRATKLLTFLVGCDKTYAATIRLGQATTTDDAEGEPVHTAAPTTVPALDPASVARAIAGLTGPLEQVPSSVSAIKVNGKRAYARVRSGEAVQLAARPVTVHRFDVLGQRPGTVGDTAVLDLDGVVEVSSGTYVRALARDLGSELAVGGHLVALRRTRVGGFDISSCRSLDDLAVAPSGADPAQLLPLATAARQALPVRELTAAEARAIAFGQPVPSQTPGRSEPVAAFAPSGDLVAVLDETGPRARSKVVFAPAAPTDRHG